MEPQPIRVSVYDQARVEVYASKPELGQAAAARAAEYIKQDLATKQYVNLCFATGVSQSDFVAALREQALDWQRVWGFHLDEYLGMSATHPASFRLWLRTRVVEPLHPAVFNYIEGDAPDIEAELNRYAALLAANPIDLGFVGLGENGHVAFNDPPVADFNDKAAIKVVELDEACQRQQVGEGWFAGLEDVPTHALSLTVPAIMRFRRILSIVPDLRKAEALRTALTGPVSTACPASILRTHGEVTYFVDPEAASLLPEEVTART